MEKERPRKEDETQDSSQRSPCCPNIRGQLYSSNLLSPDIIKQSTLTPICVIHDNEEECNAIVSISRQNALEFSCHNPCRLWSVKCICR